jgi:predicted 3-demethylubiquinone-9 3-methyltransferase (glyoxalase superfamily)
MALFGNNHQLATCLWFNGNTEQAADFYCSVFKGAKRGRTSYYGENGPLPKGSVMVVELTLLGHSFMLLHGGPHPQAKYTDAVSFMVYCRNQREIDYYWEKLSRGGKKVGCGWLQDKYGVRWQIVPDIIPRIMADKNEARASRTMQAIWKMKKLDIKKIKEAYRGK